MSRGGIILKHKQPPRTEIWLLHLSVHDPRSLKKIFLEHGVTEHCDIEFQHIIEIQERIFREVRLINRCKKIILISIMGDSTFQQWKFISKFVEINKKYSKTSRVESSRFSLW